MKKLILSIVIVLCTTIVFGQTNFGLKAGVNLSTIKGFSSKNRFIVREHFGAYANTNLNKKLFLRQELLYSVKGYGFPLTPPEKGALVFTYISMPLLFGFSPTEHGSILIGPELSYLLNAKYHSNGTVNYLKDFNNIDIAADLGVTYTINKKISTELRYSYGFKGIDNITYTDQNGNEIGSEKFGVHRVFQLSFNYRLTNK